MLRSDMVAYSIDTFCTISMRETLLLACWTTCMLQVACVLKLVWRGMAMHACSCSVQSDCVHATNKSVMQQIGLHKMFEL